MVKVCSWSTINTSYQELPVAKPRGLIMSYHEKNHKHNPSAPEVKTEYCGIVQPIRSEFPEITLAEHKFGLQNGIVYVHVLMILWVIMCMSPPSYMLLSMPFNYSFAYHNC